MTRSVMACILLGTVAAGEPGFAVRPKVGKAGGGVAVEFAADAPTDCAAWVLDASGRVVRHLAAGVLGKNAPPPLRADALAQKLEWDGKDDAGAPASGGPFKVRVALGLKPAFDGLVGFDPAALGSIRALATGPKGEAFVFHVFGGLHPSDGSLACSVLDREGKYLRTILPYPANLPAEKLKGIRRVQLRDGRLVPFLYQAETRSFVPGAGDLPAQRAVATAGGRVAFVGIQEWVGTALRYAQAGVAQLVVLGADGSIAGDSALGPVLSRRSSSGASLALSPDQKTVYATGLRDGDYAGKPTHAVYRFGWGDSDVQVFAGDRKEPGAGERQFNEPRSVATDNEGNVYVADKGNDRVVVLKPDGSYLGALAVEKPERVEVHPATGAVYVLGGPLVNALAKFASWRATQPAAKLALPHFKHQAYTVVMALDASAEPPVLWLASPQGQYARFALLRVEDKGEALGEPLDVRKAPGPPSAGAVTQVSLDRATNRLHAAAGPDSRGLFFDGPTGKPVPGQLPSLGGSGNVAAWGADGSFYAYHNYPSACLSRFTAALQPLPFAKGPRIEGLGSPRLRGRGFAVDRHGNAYVLWQTPKEKHSPGDAEDANALAVYGPDGALKNEKLVDSEIRSINSVRVDAAGNIYLAVGVRPPDRLVPPDFEGLDRGKPWKYGMNSNEMDWYPLMYGCIVKLGPEGGAIRSGIGGTPVAYGYGNKTELKGAKWLFYGASNVPSWRTKGTPDVCLCESPRFDVDPFGRSFFPDACRFRVGVLDANGNEVCWFGSYGNQDSAGPGGPMPVPDIPFCWPHAVAVGDDFAYVADRLNRRIARVRLSYAVEATCGVE